MYNVDYVYSSRISRTSVLTDGDNNEGEKNVEVITARKRYRIGEVRFRIRALYTVSPLIVPKCTPYVDGRF